MTMTIQDQARRDLRWHPITEQETEHDKESWRRKAPHHPDGQ
jgi:hypothetical protein